MKAKVNGFHGGADWLDQLMRNTEGKLLPTLHNTILALQLAPEFANRIGRDVRSKRVVAILDSLAGPAGYWGDTHSSRVCAWLEQQTMLAKPHAVAAAVEVVADSNPYNPLAEFLMPLAEQWDGQERMARLFIDYFGAEDTPLNQLIGGWFLIGAVARGISPGCQVDHMPVIEGPQGQGKSSAVRILAGPFGCERLPDFHSKDAIMALTTSWIAEVADMGAMKRSDVKEIKAFLTVTKDTFRPPYGRHPITVPRSTVFFGTINPDGQGYLEDNTGNRRMWPIKTGQIELDKLKADRTQLLAEAVHCFNRRDPWWPIGTEQRELAGEQQELRTIQDEWHATILLWAGANVGPWEQVTTSQVASQALGIIDKELDRTSQIRIGYALKQAGFIRFRKRTEHGLVWVYKRAEA